MSEPAPIEDRWAIDEELDGKFPREVTLAVIDLLDLTARTYKRDKDGKFSSGGGGATPKMHAIRTVSPYAASSESELAAETFADVMTRGDAASDVSKAAFDVIDGAYHGGAR